MYTGYVITRLSPRRKISTQRDLVSISRKNGWEPYKFIEGFGDAKPSRINHPKIKSLTFAKARTSESYRAGHISGLLFYHLDVAAE